jgi:acetyl-CoA carboxylase biotin carboxylase subunit
MIKKLLIANRGEIAVRIIRGAKELGIKTVAIYSEVDKDSLHTKLADETICIGPSSPSQSYLSIPRIISTCELMDVDAVHPGYGFLAESPRFAEICEESGFKFIGPKPESMKIAGDKILAKRKVEEIGIPTIPGSKSGIETIEEAIEVAKKVGYPILLKAAAGGGGRGMRKVYSEEELRKMFEVSKREAKIGFGDERIYLEKLLINPRHIEVQILGDEYGNIISLCERECSIQRRHQKLIEEAPAPNLSEKVREKLNSYAIEIAEAINYSSAGTIEFLVEGEEVYFLEINSRIQVEHPVTEMVSGVDIVKEQLLIANGKKIDEEKIIYPKGHAIECRINAEDWKNDFKPSPGEILQIYFPGGPGVRVETHIYSGYKIPANYDSLIAKLITYGKDRKEAICRMERALEEFKIEGISSTIEFYLEIIRNERFRKGEVNTNFIKGK